VDDYVEAALHAKMKHYDSIATQFSKFFHEDELANRFAAKVDVERFKEMENVKASRDELNQTLRIIDSLFERLRNLSLLQVEVSRSLAPLSSSGTFDAQQTAQERQTKNEYLLKQSQLMYNWILEFGSKLEKRDMQPEPEHASIPFKEFESYCFKDNNASRHQVGKGRFQTVDKSLDKIKRATLKSQAGS
jgi:hypothetical protein